MEMDKGMGDIGSGCDIERILIICTCSIAERVGIMTTAIVAQVALFHHGTNPSQGTEKSIEELR